MEVAVYMLLIESLCGLGAKPGITHRTLLVRNYCLWFHGLWLVLVVDALKHVCLELLHAQLAVVTGADWAEFIRAWCAPRGNSVC